MPRRRSFDETDVVERAMEIFWTQGYEATSYTDLTAHVGLHPGSLYRAFGDKQAIFLRSLEHYRDSQTRTLAPFLLAGGPVLPRIRAVLVGYLDLAARQQPAPRGCLIANTAGERLPGDAAVAARLAEILALVEDGFLQGLRKASQEGEVAPGLDLPASAAMLTMLLEGLQVLVKSDPDPQRLARAVDTALAGLAARPDVSAPADEAASSG
ncbi:TetR/AcrR family transcriptional regulator [Pseudonocardia xinjiangensis]|uniref:TetR/AcrR family transcriptional regulator n=1 Tax=Pseudonocardia xinjiangensis TaxID=75289 RepID=A0ABX1RA61_9PSEU|nr:TetR/AcrR family transcriptional regulator [Pseudonocardia xinjiangensis]NMH76309.1 TetR/AcrR family transcriptional regulator [Pseudonocardia xinjiangensis]